MKAEGEFGEKFKKILEAPFKTEHEDALEAVAADIADVIPIVGEIAGLYRIKKAMDEGDDTRVLLEVGDLFAGFPPLIGDILDILTPTNLIIHLMKKRK